MDAVDSVKLKCGRPDRIRFAHDGRGPSIDGHPRDMWQYGRRFKAGDTSRFEGQFQLEKVAGGVTLWQLHAAGTPRPTLSLIAGRQPGLVQVKWMGHVLVSFPIADLPTWCPFTAHIVTHPMLGRFNIQVADYPPLAWSGISTMMGDDEWHHVGVLSGINDPDQPEVAAWWRDFALLGND